MLRSPCVRSTLIALATDVAGWNQRLAEWDYDMAFTYVYQYGDPALGVTRNYVSSNIAKGSQWNNVVLFDESFAFQDSRARWLYTGITRAAKRLTIVV